MIDMEPKVGRIVMRDSLLIAGQCSRGGVITRISGKRVYYQPQDEHEEEKYTQKPTAICDTEEEVQALLDFSKSMTDEMFAIQQQLRQHEAKSNNLMKKILAAGRVDVINE